MKAKRFKWLVRLATLFAIYMFVGGVLVFYVDQPGGEEYAEQISTERFYGEGIGPDQAAILDERQLSGLSRVHLMENAQETMQIAYYTVQDGLSSDIFYGLIMEAAERGVQVQLLFDGIFHNLRGAEKKTYWALVDHPHIEVRFYEPLNVLKPWTLNNRLHDKIMIVDDKYAMAGGRNIGDPYFLDAAYLNKEIVEDRDVLIYNTNPDAFHESVLSEFSDYFQLLWSHKYTIEKHQAAPPRHRQQAQQRQEELLHKLARLRKQHPNFFEGQIDWTEQVHPTRKITLITNPIQRLKKEPWILSEMSALFKSAEDVVVAQSPYIIPSRQMMAYMNDFQTEAELFLLTNSKASTPNYFGIAGYLKHRDRLAEYATELYEYSGPGSIHAKSYVFDHQLSLIGSFNIDARSSFLSTESMVVIDSVPIAETLVQYQQSLVEQSTLYPHDGQETARPVPWNKRVVIWFMKWMLYPFDELL